MRYVPDPPMATLLTIDDLAAVLRLSVATIWNRRSKAPHTLPPAVDLPGAGGLRWRQQDVEAWLEAHLSAAAVQAPRRRGRPTKAEQIERQRAEAAAAAAAAHK